MNPAGRSTTAALLLCALAFFGLIPSAHAEEAVTRYYVWKETKTNKIICYSTRGWDTAERSVASGLWGFLDGSTVIPPVEVHVKEGTYTLDQPSRTFLLQKGVSLYGGYPKSAAGTDLSGRDWRAHPTTLNRNEAYPPITIVTPGADATPEDTRIDGFFISSGSNTAGGGMRNVRSSPLVINCEFTGNEATQMGGGMYNEDASPLVVNCTFKTNKNSASDVNGAYYGGGGVYNTNSSPRFVNCAFLDNKAANVPGGGMFNASGSAPTVENSTFRGNMTSRGGGAVYNDLSSPTFINCTFTGNEADQGGALFDADAGPTLVNCTIADNTAELGAGMYDTAQSSPVLVNTILWGEGAARHGGAGPAPESCLVSLEDLNLTLSADTVLNVPHSFYELEKGSPAIGAGQSSFERGGLELVPRVDQLGRPRGARVSIGSWEYSAVTAEDEGQGNDGQNENGGDDEGGGEGTGANGGSGGPSNNGGGTPLIPTPRLTPIPDGGGEDDPGQWNVVPTETPDKESDGELESPDDDLSDDVPGGGEADPEDGSDENNSDENNNDDEQGPSAPDAAIPEPIDPAGGTCGVGWGTAGLWALGPLLSLPRWKCR